MQEPRFVDNLGLEMKNPGNQHLPMDPGSHFATLLSTVNAPYGTDLDVSALADQISRTGDVTACSGPVFSFFSEGPLELQVQFITERGLDVEAIRATARRLSAKVGYSLPLSD